MQGLFWVEKDFVLSSLDALESLMSINIKYSTCLANEQ